MNYVYFKENNQYVKVNNITGEIKLRRDYPYWYIPEATEERMIYFKRIWKYAKDIETALWFGNRLFNSKFTASEGCKCLLKQEFRVNETPTINNYLVHQSWCRYIRTISDYQSIDKIYWKLNVDCSIPKNRNSGDIMVCNV